jgi:phage regulator Rha-like protein
MAPPQPAYDLGNLIFIVRGQRVILDVHLARLYGVSTGALNQAVKRNANRFPNEFAFRVTVKEVANLKSQTVISSLHGGSRHLPFAFTEHGVLMAANVLKSTRATDLSIALIKAFVRLRELLADTQLTAKRLAEIEKTLLTHDVALRDIYKKIAPLLLPAPEPPRKKIGF